MNESFETNGFWWLPETPENRVPGTLSFSPGDVPRLKLMGTLNIVQESSFPPPEFINPMIIQGSAMGQPVTLYKCLQKSGKSNIGVAGSYYATEFLAHIAFFGAYFFTQADIQFSSLSVQFHNLDSWYNMSCIQTTTPEPGTELITIKIPEPINFQINDHQIQISVWKSECLNLNGTSLSVRVSVNISNPTAKPLEDYFELLRLLQYFFTFALTEPTFVIKMTGQVTDKLEKAEGEFSSLGIIKIYYSAIGWQSNARDIFWADMLMPYSEMETNLPQLIRAWVEKAETIKPVYDLYFAGKFRSTYPENEFLSLTQAIETYHRRVYGGQYQSEEIFLKDLYPKLVAAIPSSVSPEFRSSLKNGKLRYAHEYSLRRRILLLAEHITENIPVNFLIDSHMRRDFSEKIADTRNYLTHYSPELRARAITDGPGLFELNQQLSLLLTICLLEELNIPVTEILRIVKKDRRFKRNILGV